MAIFGGAPDPQAPVGLDPSVQALIDAQKQRANASPESFSQDASSGIDQAKVFSQSDQSINQEAQRNSVDPGLLAAIRNQYQQEADTSLGQLKAKGMANASLYKGDLLNRQAKMQLAQQGAKLKQNEFLASAYNQIEQARSGFVNSLFQTFNYGYGMYKGSQKNSNVGVDVNPPQQQPITNNFSGPQTPPTPQYDFGQITGGSHP